MVFIFKPFSSFSNSPLPNIFISIFWLLYFNIWQERQRAEKLRQREEAKAEKERLKQEEKVGTLELNEWMG